MEGLPGIRAGNRAQAQAAWEVKVHADQGLQGTPGSLRHTLPDAFRGAPGPLFCRARSCLFGGRLRHLRLHRRHSFAGGKHPVKVS
ncbi:MAG: hypothetical protein CMJ99_02335, partial [Planctomycetes bacterium]|nr:hypothetical protein [Planctomycetota bacterium]